VDPKKEEEENGGFQLEGAESTYSRKYIYIYFFFSCVHIHIHTYTHTHTHTHTHTRARALQQCAEDEKGKHVWSIYSGSGYGMNGESLSNKPILLRLASRVYPQGAGE